MNTQLNFVQPTIPSVQQLNSSELQDFDGEPPAYEEIVVEEEEEPPPTYDDLFGELKQIRDASTLLHFGNFLLKFLHRKDEACYFKIIIIVIHMSVIIIGAANLEYCPTQRLIPRFLLTFGILAAFKTFLLFVYYRNKTNFSEHPYLKKRFTIVYRLHDVIIFAWCIAGSFWLFNSSPSFTALNQTYCNKLTFILSYIILISYYIVFSIVVLFHICSYAAKISVNCFL